MSPKIIPEAEAEDPRPFLAPGRFIDSDSPEIVAYAERVVGDAGDEREKGRRLFLAVRDDLRYDPYRIGRRPDDFTASRTLRQGYGFCITKAAVLAAAARSQGIPARLGFADVRNHLTSPKLREMMGGSDLFVFHGYAELHLGGAWIKATPAFNRGLCEKTGITPLDFDGAHDAIFHPFDTSGRRHMEYVRYRGVCADIPFAEMLECYAEAYGPLINQATTGEGRDFEREART